MGGMVSFLEGWGLKRFESYFQTTFRFSVTNAFIGSNKIGVFVLGCTAVVIGAGVGVAYSMQNDWASSAG